MSLVGIERCKEAVLKRCVLRRLAQVAVHFASTAEKTRSTPAEDAGATKYCFTILARFLGQRFSLAFHQSSTFASSSGSSASASYLSSSSRAGAAGESPSITASFLTRPPSSPPSDTFPCFFGGSTSVGVSGVGVGMPVVPTLGAATGRGFHTVDHSRRGPVVVNQVVNRVVNG